MSKILIAVAIVSVASGLAIGQDKPAPQVSVSASAAAPTSNQQGPWFSERHPRYELKPSDVFDVSFEYTPEFNQTVTVQPDGYVTMRGVGDIEVVGKTVEQATETIRSSYEKLLNHPQVSVVLKDFQKPYFVADGQVGHPGKFELRDDTTVSQAIAMAGGFLPSAKHSQVVLYRRVSDKWMQGTLIDVKKMEKSHDLSEDAHLQPGDMVFVPKNGISKAMPFLPIPSANVSMIPLARP
jgi:polysaccharide export outer membrane protein